MAKSLFYFLFFLGFLFHSNVMAQGKFFLETSQPMVEAGQVMLVIYTLEDEEPNRFFNPDFSPFTVVSGPNKSTSISIMNGQRSMKSTWRFQILAPQQTGTYTLPAAKVVTTQNKELRAEGVKVEVVDDVRRRSSTANTDDRKLPTDKDFFISVDTDSEVAYPGQLVVLTCKLYSRVDLVSIELMSIPDVAESARFKLKQMNTNTNEEFINGKRYFSKVIQRIAIFPQKPGVIQIDPYVLRVARKSGTAEDNWFPFSRNYNYETVASNPAELMVTALPTPIPESFSGAVGKYDATMYFDPPLAKAGQSLTATLKIRGVGDLKRFQAPKIEWPEGLEQYDVLTISEEYAELTSGLMGEKSFEYVLVPQEAGTYPLPAVFTYYDTEAKEYKTIDLSDQSIQIREGTDPSYQQNMAEQEAKANTSTAHSTKKTDAVSWKTYAIGGVAAVLLLGIALFFIQYQKKRTVKQDQSFKDECISRLEVAYQSPDKDHFFLELHRIMYRWISRETNIPPANLNKKSAQSFLNNHLMNADDRAQFLDLLSKCEQTLYMPGSIQSDTSESFAIARQLLDKYI